MCDENLMAIQSMNTPLSEEADAIIRKDKIPLHYVRIHSV